MPNNLGSYYDRYFNTLWPYAPTPNVEESLSFDIKPAQNGFIVKTKDGTFVYGSMKDLQKAMAKYFEKKK